MKKLLPVFALSFLLLALACSTPSDSDNDAPPSGGSGVTAITITPGNAHMEKGGSLQFYAAVTVTGGVSPAAAWSLSGNKSSLTTLSATGNGATLSIAADESAATLTVTAVSTVDAGKTKSAAVTVWNPGEAPENLLTVTKLTILPRHNISEFYMVKGGVVPLYALINDSDMVTQNVTWSFYHNPIISTFPPPERPGSALSSSGLLTIAADEPPKSFKVEAVYTPDPSISAQLIVNLWDADTEKELLLTPRADQETYVGAPVQDQVKVRAVLRHFKGKVTESLPEITYSGSGAKYVNRNTGVFEPSAAGTYTVTASYEGQSVTSGPITVHSADYLFQPYHYPGTDTTYQGYQGPITYDGPIIGYDLTPRPVISQNEITVLEPSVTCFNADRFVILDIIKPAVYDYVDVTVSYVEGQSAEPSRYPDNFYTFAGARIKERIWLRYKAGLYRIEIGTQSFHNGNFSATVYLPLFVNNTQNEPSRSDAVDRRYILPSPKVQSDKLLITNTAKMVTFGVTGTTEKIKAIHDYIVINTVYDKARSQDALSVLGTRYPYDVNLNPLAAAKFPDGHFFGDCEGYSFSMSALLRASGIESKNVGNYIHQWNNVYVNGSWKLLDATWDDFNPISYEYFLINSLTGVNNDHPLMGETEFFICD